MSTLRLYPFLRMRPASQGRSLRAACGSGPISLRTLLPTFSMPIYDKWLGLDGERGRLGAATALTRKAVIDGATFLGQRFDHGTAIDLGRNRVTASVQRGGGTGGGAALPEVPYVLTLESISCRGQSQGETGSDELWLRFVFSAETLLNESDEASAVVNFRPSGWQAGVVLPVDLLIYGGALPEVFKLAYMVVEVDLDSDAQQVMDTFSSKVQEREKLWFNAGSTTNDAVLWANIAMNSVGTAICIASPNPWVQWLGGISGTAMEIALLAILDWYRAELVGALEVNLLGEDMRSAIQGSLPQGTGDEPIEITVRGGNASEKIVVLMRCTFSRFDNGDIKEERRFTGTDPQVDYTLTFRHFLGCEAGPLPAAPVAFSLEPEYRYAWNESHGTSTFLHAINHLQWKTSDASVVACEVERAINGQHFVNVATRRLRNAETEMSYVDTLVQHAGEVFQYRVRAYNRSGYSAYANTITAKLPSPDAPYGLSASTQGGTPRQVHVYWMVSSEGDTRYALERARGGEDFIYLTDVPARTPSTEGANHVDIVTNPRPGEVLRYRVQAYNEYGEASPYSAVLEVAL